jgi:O-antigen ligase
MAILLMYKVKLADQPAHKWVMGILITGLVFVPLLPSAYLDRLTTIWNIEEDETGSAQARRDVTIGALKLAIQNPILGTGLGMHSLALSEIMGPKVKGVHNVYLEYAADLGVPGLSLFLLLFAGCVKSTRAVRRQCAGIPQVHDLYVLATGLEISLWAFAAAGPFYPVAYRFYFYFIGGLSMAVWAVYEVRSLQRDVIGVIEPLR